MKKLIPANEVKKIQLSILESIDNFCQSKNLRYSLAYGTLIGAIRHKGYIPWDDDIDIMMPRPDYERLMSEYPGFNKYYSVQNYKNDDSYYLGFCKVYDNRTEEIIFPTRTGVFVDIFPVDGVPSSQEELQGYINKKRRLVCRDLLYTAENNSFRTGNRLLITMKTLIKRLISKNRRDAIKELDELYNAYPFEESETVGSIIVETGSYGYFNRKMFESYIDVDFENLVVKCIADYDTFLHDRFGDYMQLPPVEERIPGHNAEIYWKSPMSGE